MAPLPPQPGVHHQGQALLLRLGHPQALLQVRRDAAAAVCVINETSYRLRHHASCVRASELYGTNTTSLAYLAAGGRLGNTMSTYAAMLAVRSDNT